MSFLYLCHLTVQRTTDLGVYAAHYSFGYKTILLSHKLIQGLKPQFLPMATPQRGICFSQLCLWVMLPVEIDVQMYYQVLYWYGIFKFSFHDSSSTFRYSDFIFLFDGQGEAFVRINWQLCSAAPLIHYL